MSLSAAVAIATGWSCCVTATGIGCFAWWLESAGRYDVIALKEELSRVRQDLAVERLKTTLHVPPIVVLSPNGSACMAEEDSPPPSPLRVSGPDQSSPRWLAPAASPA